MTSAIARADVRLLALVARLPFTSTRHLAVLSGELACAGVYRCAARLLERGLLCCVAGPSASGVGRSPRLLYPTDLGRVKVLPPGFWGLPVKWSAGVECRHRREE